MKDSNMLMYDEFSANYFNVDEGTIESCVKRIREEFDDLIEEATEKYQKEEEKMESQKKFVSIELKENSEVVEIRIHPRDCYICFTDHALFYARGICSENASLYLLVDVAEHIIGLLINNYPDLDSRIISSIAYRIVFDFIESGVDKCMWDITDNEHIVKIDPCKDCGDQCLYISEEDENEYDEPKLSDIQKEITDLNQRVEFLAYTVFPEDKLSLSKQVDLLKSTKDNIVKIMDDHEKRLKEFEDRLTKAEAFNLFLLTKTNFK